MRTPFRAIAAAILLLVGTAFADPFTGRYNIMSLPDRGVSITGHIDFSGAPMPTSSFNLGAAFVAGFEIVASGPGIDTLTYNSLAQTGTDGVIMFDNPLGSPTLTPLVGGAFWTGVGDLDGQADGADFVQMVMFGTAGVDWAAGDEGGPTFGRDSTVPPAWKLVLVPEPGILTLMSIGGVLLVWRKRRRGRAKRI